MFENKGQIGQAGGMIKLQNEEFKNFRFLPDVREVK
jgi:hypothetical protein